VIVCKQAYDPQTGYDMSYFQPPIDETVQGQGQPSPREVNLPAIILLDVQGSMLLYIFIAY
jgi:hypothetical protein